jgi:hypothetical protein
MEVTGLVSKILPKVEGQKKDGSGTWVKQEFIVSNNEGYEGREQIFCFEVFGEEKVESFNKYNKVGSSVKVDFNIKTNEYKEKYYTSLQAWKIFKAEDASPTAAPFKQIPDSELNDVDDSLPF